jgi:hypothetical protein
MEIADSARRHGVADDDMLHGIRNFIADVSVGQPEDRILFIGPARNGQLLEIVVIDPDDNPAIVHAMKLRTKFHRYLPR